MASMEELMLIFRAKDEVSGVTGQIDNEIQSMASSASAALASITSGMASISTVSDNLIGSLNSGQSASELIFGTSSRAETNKVLLNNMTSTQEAAENLYKTVDQVTDSSLTSMQDLIPALNAFKAATGASDQEIINITDDMANFGAAVLAQTGSTALAETAMMSLSKGIKGAFAALDQYGVSEDALMRTGLWNGEEDDVEGFMEAVTKVMGSTEELMQTNQGLDALIQKAFSRGGKKIGNEFLPVIKDVKRAFIDLDNELGGNLTAGILVLGEGIDVMNSALFNIGTAANGIRELKNGLCIAVNWIKDITGIGEAARDTTDALTGMANAMNSVSNVGEIGANVSSVGAAGVEVAGGASRGERAIDAGADVLGVADIFGGSRDVDSARKEVMEEIGSRKSYARRIQKELDELQSLETATVTSFVTSSSKPKPTGGQSPFNFLDELIKNHEGQAGAHSKDFLMDRLFGKDNPLLNGDLNREARVAASESLDLMEEAGEFLFDDDLLEVWEHSEDTFSGMIKNHFVGFKDKITGAFGALKDFDFKGALLSPFRKIADFDFSGSFQNLLEKGFGGLGNITRGISSKFSDFRKSLSNLKFPDIRGKFSEINKSLGASIRDFSFSDSISSLREKLGSLRGVGEVAEEVDDVVDGLDAMGDVAEAAGAAAPAMEAGAAGAEATAVAGTSLSAAFTSMIVPALAIAAVIIILIPIVAAIAAEAMIFIKLLGEFMESLNFDNINLTGAIEGIKQIAIGLAYVGVAMAAMSFTSIMTGLAIITSGFTGILAPLDVAVAALKEADTKLAAFANVSINENAAANIKRISDSLSAVSMAMLSITTVTITTGFTEFVSWALQFSSVGESLERAKGYIIDASSKLEEFSNMPTLPDSVAQNIQNVCNSLKSVGDAIGALRSIRDGQNWDNIIGGLMEGIFGPGLDIGQALERVKVDIQNAATALQGWAVQDIPQDLGEKIGKVSSALQTINDTFQNLRGMRDDGNWDAFMGGIFGGMDIQGALNKIRTDLETAAQAIAAMRIGQVDAGKIEAIGQIGNAIQKISEVATTLSNMPPMANTFNPASLTTAINAIQTAAQELGRLSTTTFGEGQDPSSMLGTINTAITGVRDTLNNLAGGFSAPATNIGTQIVTGVQSGLSPLGGTIQSSLSSAVGSAAGTATSGGQTLGSNMTNGFRSNLKLADVMTAEMGHVKSAVDAGISAAVSAAESGAKQVVDAFKRGINTGSPGDIANTMDDEMGYTNQFLTDAFGPLGNAAYNLGRRIVDSFGNPTLDMNIMDPITPTELQRMELMTSPSPTRDNANVTNIVVQEGAIPIDARNMTQKEARQMLVLALESLDLFDPNPSKGVA